MTKRGNQIECESLQLACPHCGSNRAHRPIWVDAFSFNAQCQSCGSWWQSPLPRLNRKLIALDTNVVSNLMKIANVDFPAARRDKLPAEWRLAYERLKTAVHLQAAACPRTPTLASESLLYQYGPAIDDMAELLDAGLKCRPQAIVEQHQLYLAAKAHANGCTPSILDRRHIYLGRMNEWPNWFRIKVNMGLPRNSPEDVRKRRDAAHASGTPILERWRRTPMTLDQIFRNEKAGMARGLIQANTLHRHRFLRALMNPASEEHPEELLLNCSAQTMGMIRIGLRRDDTKEPSSEDTINFLMSDGCEIPTNQIRAALFAFEARQIAGGHSPTASMWLDIEMISTMLPYVDAIVLEGHFAGAIGQVRRLLPSETLATRVFSVRQLDQFIDYLDELIANTPEEQSSAANWLYGPAA